MGKTELKSVTEQVLFKEIMLKLLEILAILSIISFFLSKDVVECAHAPRLRREAEEKQMKFEMKRTDAKRFAAKPSAKRQDAREGEEGNSGFFEYEYVEFH